MVDVFKITIPELTGRRKKRRVYVYLPEFYDEDPERRYPVLYMFDGQNVFFDEDATYGKSWGMKDYMDATGMPFIIAAVECNDSPNNGRLREYAPYSFREDGIGRITGKGRITMEWWIHTFKPMIDEKYRTLPFRETTFIAGSSMGGLMSVYALLEYNQYFSGAAALSPSLWTGRRKIEQLIQTAEIDPNTVLYIDYGDLEFDNHFDMRSAFGRTVSLLIARGIKVTARIIPGGTHCEASWERQVPFFMNVLSYEEGEDGAGDGEEPDEGYHEDEEYHEDEGYCEEEGYQED